MSSSASKVESGEINFNVSGHNPPSKLKTYGFTIAIIMGIGGLAVGAVGSAGYFHAGAFGITAQLDVIVMMAAGGGTGAILLIIANAVKNRKSTGYQPSSTPSPIVTAPVDVSRCIVINPVDTPPPIATGLVDASQPIDTKDGVFYGPEAWRKWNVEVLDVVPPAPAIDLTKKDKVLLYMPESIRINGKEQNLTLKAFREMRDAPVLVYFDQFIERQLEGIAACRGWVLIDKNVLPESQGKTYEAQQKIVAERECSMPRVLEAVVLNLMVLTFTSRQLGQQLFGLIHAALK